MTKKISALPAGSAMDGTEALEIIQGGASKKGLISDITTRALAVLKASAANAKDTTNVSTLLTPANLLDVQALRLLFTLTGANMNSTADQQFTKVGTFTTWRPIGGIYLMENASADMTTCAGGIYSAASKGGYTLVAASQTYTTTGGVFGAQYGVRLTPTNAVGVQSVTPYFALTTGHGSASTADLYIYGAVVS